MPRELPIFYEGRLGQYFRDLRENRGWSLRQAVLIAEQRKLPVTLGALRWLEGGLTKNPERELLRALSVLYGEPFGKIVQEVARHVFAIKPSELLHGTPPPTSIKGFVAIPFLSQPIAAGQPLRVEADSAPDDNLVFKQGFVKRFTRPVCLRVSRHEDAMAPTIQSGDVVLIDQNITRRRKPRPGHVYAVNYDPLIGRDGGVLHRVELSGRTLVLSSDHSDKAAYPTRTFDITASMLPDVLLGEVVWVGRAVGTARR